MAEKILVVDDDVDSLKLIGLMLQRQGYEIIAANSGAQAIAKAGVENPNLIILDVMMPDMDGYEVCKRLRANAQTQAIPIIMFTAKTLVDDKVAGFEAGADDYLTKPTHPAELASRVKAVLLRSAAQRRTSSAETAGLALGFLGAKGGVGTTTLAMNVAAVMVAKESTSVMDMRLGQGSLGLMLNFGRSQGLANLLSRPSGDINARAVENELVAHSNGLKLLLSSTRPKESQLNINPDTAALVLKHLRTLTRNVCVDLGAGLTKQAARLVKEVDQLILVVEPNRVTLNMGREMLRELETMGIGRGRTNVVIVDRVKSPAQVPWQEAEQILSHDMLAVIAPVPDLAIQAADAGFPMVSFQPNSIVASQIGKLTEELVTRGSAVNAAGA
jgi:DNA-binding response OmpR family regulator